MLNESEDVDLFQRAKEAAREIVGAYDESAKFAILTNDFQAKHEIFQPAEETIANLEELMISPKIFEWNIVANKTSRLLKDVDSENLNAFVLSDFQTDLDQYETHRTRFEYYLAVSAFFIGAGEQH